MYFLSNLYLLAQIEQADFTQFFRICGCFSRNSGHATEAYCGWFMVLLVSQSCYKTVHLWNKQNQLMRGTTLFIDTIGGQIMCVTSQVHCNLPNIASSQNFFMDFFNLKCLYTRLRTVRVIHPTLAKPDSNLPNMNLHGPDS